MDKIIFFAILILFPFGQILKIGFINLFDGAVLLLAIVTLLKKPVYPSWYKYFIYFILACIFGLVINYSLFTIQGLLYLVRFVSYSYVAVYVFNFYKNPKSLVLPRSGKLRLYLISIAVASATFGWLQYLIWPDLTSLKYLGWDDHLFRMVGTFLDPTFLGLILILGVIIALHKRNYLAFYFLAFSLLFTYSRSSYLILFLVFIFDLIQNKKLFRFLLLNSIFLLLFILPKNIGEGTNFIRTTSANKKLINYQETLEIFKKSPVFGIGFNNMCLARQKYLGDININSHSCSGADSSVLFLLATTGIIGTALLLYAVCRMPYDSLLKASFLAVFIHSLQANSLFYPHIMFWLFVLVGLRSKIHGKI